jgi:hypothetical protein
VELSGAIELERKNKYCDAIPWRGVQGDIGRKRH